MSNKNTTANKNKSVNRGKSAQRIARILALLSISQLRGKTDKLGDFEIEDLLLKTTRTLTLEVKMALETAADELNRSNTQLIKSETRTNNITTARNMLKESINLTQNAINNLGEILDIPNFVQVSNRREVKDYANRLIKLVQENEQEVNELIEEVMVGWSLARLTQVDGNIIRICVTEMLYLNLAHRIAIDEAIEIAKEYSDEDGHRFINGVLRKVSDQMNQKTNNVEIV